MTDYENYVHNYVEIADLCVLPEFREKQSHETEQNTCIMIWDSSEDHNLLI